jgi:DNA end-binding protein Ku
MRARSIASLSLSFGLVAIPVKLYSATENSAAIRFKLMASGGRRLKQQYVTEPSTRSVDEEPLDEDSDAELETDRSLAHSRGAFSKVVNFPSSRVVPAIPAMPVYERPKADAEGVIERSEMVKGFEYEKGKFVVFTAEELKALQSESRKTIDIVSFIPEKAVDPLYYDKAYLLAPDKRGLKPYNLLLRAMHDTGRCALARWAFRSKEYVVQIRAAEGGMVLQQLLYAEEVRSFAGLDIEATPVGDAELNLAKQLIAQISADSYNPSAFVDEEKKRIFAAVEKKIAGKQLNSPAVKTSPDRKVVDLLGALRASLQLKADMLSPGENSKSPAVQRKPAKRASKPLNASLSSKARSGKR